MRKNPPRSREYVAGGSGFAAKPQSALVGSLVLNRFLIERRIGSGGFGTVYEAWDGRLERPVAVKAIDSGGSGGGGGGGGGGAAGGRPNPPRAPTPPTKGGGGGTKAARTPVGGGGPPRPA